MNIELVIKTDIFRVGKHSGSANVWTKAVWDYTSPLIFNEMAQKTYKAWAKIHYVSFDNCFLNLCGLLGLIHFFSLIKRKWLFANPRLL